MKKTILSWLINGFVGIFFSFGLVHTIYLIITAFDMYTYDRKMVMFLLISLVIGWACSIIYHFNAKLTVTAILHGIVWFMLAVVCYMNIFEIAIAIEKLIQYMVIYGTIYWIVLSLFMLFSKKLNTPFRQFNEFIAKLTQFITK